MKNAIRFFAFATVLSNQQNNQKTIFFLGAGASVDAGLSDVVGLVDKFLKSQNIEQADLIRKIITTIKDWKVKHNDESKIDIEILLDTVEKIESRDDQPLSAFYKNTSLKIEKHSAYT